MHNWLRLSELAAVDINSPERLRVHADVLARKRMIREVFTEYHRLFLKLDEHYFGDARGVRVELGAGVSPVRDTFPDVLASDVMLSGKLDLVTDAEHLALAQESVRAFYLQNCFHHFPNPRVFFSEVLRCLAPGGGVILLEPYYGPVAARVFKRLFPSETFDASVPSWESQVAGPMEGANQALSYVVFVRDRTRFQEEFPQLEIAYQEVMTNYPRYLLSGGLNFKQLMPDIAIPLLKAIEWLSAPLARVVGLHYIMVLSKRR
jgi:SAM-dependent methyltransferase